MDAFLIVQRGEDIGRRYDLDTTQLTVGRGSDNDMVLNDPMVSRYHAVVKRHGNRFSVIDLGSSNPVVINDQALEPGMPQQLQHRDVVFIGKTVFSFQNRGQGAAQAQPPASRPDQTIARPQSGPLTPPLPDYGSAYTAPPVADRPAPPVTPTLETPIAPANRGEAPEEKTVIGPAPAENKPADDNERTMVGPIQFGEPAERPTPPPTTPHFPAPPPAAQARNDDQTNPGIRPPVQSFPPPPPPSTPPTPGGDRVVGTPPDDEDSEMPTQIVPRR
jgi:pSer/pThr/pTyr-binding forkhead associated (FHA) protein